MSRPVLVTEEFMRRRRLLRDLRTMIAEVAQLAGRDAGTSFARPGMAALVRALNATDVEIRR
jgi:hypothetical protein